MFYRSPSPLRSGRFPEFAVLMFAFLLNLPWELLQIPFFAGMHAMPHWDGVRQCARAAAGDTFIILVAFWVTAAVCGSRHWLERPRIGCTALFLVVGFGAAMVAEVVSVRVLSRWAYAPGMPVLHGTGLGLLPMLQWLVLPLGVVWLARRHLGPVSGERQSLVQDLNDVR